MLIVFYFFPLFRRPKCLLIPRKVYFLLLFASLFYFLFFSNIGITLNDIVLVVDMLGLRLLGKHIKLTKSLRQGLSTGVTLNMCVNRLSYSTLEPVLTDGALIRNYLKAKKPTGSVMFS